MARVLIAESDKDLREAMSRTLLQAGHKVIATPSGAIAQRVLLADQEYDLIISGNETFEMKGIDLLKWVKENHPTKNIPFVLYTGMSSLGRKCRRMGGIFLDKSSIEPLHKTINRILPGSKT